MSREIKFEFLYKRPTFSSTNSDFNWHRKVFTLDQLCEKPLWKLSYMQQSCKLVAKRQFTGLTNYKGDEVYDGDVLKLKTGGLVLIEYSKTDIGFVGLVESLGEYQSLVFFKAYKEFDIAGNIYQNPELLGDSDG
jgi:hypothetical protein